MSDEILLRNAALFIRMRWAVAVALAGAGTIFALLGERLGSLGIHGRADWPLALSLILLLSNVLFRTMLRYRTPEGFLSPSVNIWSQIVLDLAVLTAGVHFTGSTGSPAPLLYVLHIALAGVFLSAEMSFLVVILVWIFYGACAGLELSGLLAPAGIFGPSQQGGGLAVAIQVVMTDTVLFLAWYLVSRLTAVIRAREDQLLRAVEDARTARLDKDRYSAQMTHQLKAPLDAIRSRIALITNGYTGPVSSEVGEELRKMDGRAAALARFIVDVLRFSHLNGLHTDTTPGQSDLADLLRRCADALSDTARKRGITVVTDLAPLRADAPPDQIRLLFENLISNAVQYSRDQGRVEIRLYLPSAGAGPVAEIRDQGIGIPAERLPKLFDDFFRTSRAAEHNPSSSGVGLAIVRRVAVNNGLRIQVESEADRGTLFKVLFPAPVLQ